MTKEIGGENVSLPASYMTGSFTKIPQSFETMLTAKAPDKFTTRFQEIIHTADLTVNGQYL